MQEKKQFIRGVVFGIAFVILASIFINSISIVYSTFFKHQMSAERKLKEINKIIDTYYVNDYDEKDLQEGMFAGWVSGLDDKYSYYMDRDTFTNFLESTEGSYVGIGVVVSVLKDDNSIVIIDKYAGMPADKAGIQIGDKILSINDVNVNGENYNDAVKMMKGKSGTKINLKIYRTDTNETKDIEIITENVNIPTVSHEMLDDNIGYIKISRFERVTYDQFVNAYNDLNNKNMNGLIIDLRDNPGGLLDVVVNITDMLVPKGYVTYIEDKNGKKEYQYSDENCIDKPLAVLVNGGSASASEVLSGAVKDFKTGKLVGTQTYGKGVVQSIYKLSDGSGVKVTVAKYYTPSGVCIDGEGITPDYIVEMPETEDGTVIVDFQLNKAIEVVKGEK